MLFLGQAGDAGREAGRNDILAVSPSVLRWARVAGGGHGFVDVCSAGLGGAGGEGALLRGPEGDGEVGRSFMCAHRGEWRCVEHWGQLMDPKSIFVGPWGQS